MIPSVGKMFTTKAVEYGGGFLGIGKALPNALVIGEFMSRQRLSIQKVLKYRQQYPTLDIVGILVRGNTGGRKHLCLRDGRIVYLYPDGTFEHTPYTWAEGLFDTDIREMFPWG